VYTLKKPFAPTSPAESEVAVEGELGEGKVFCGSRDNRGKKTAVPQKTPCGGGTGSDPKKNFSKSEKWKKLREGDSNLTGEYKKKKYG